MVAGHSTASLVASAPAAPAGIAGGHLHPGLRQIRAPECEPADAYVRQAFQTVISISNGCIVVDGEFRRQALRVVAASRRDERTRILICSTKPAPAAMCFAGRLPPERHAHPRPLPHRGQAQRGRRQGQAGRGEGAGRERARRPQEPALRLPEAAGEPDRRAARRAPEDRQQAQPQDGPRLSLERVVPPVLGIRMPRRGLQVPAPLVPRREPKPPQTHQGLRQDPAQARGPDPQLVQGQEAVLKRRGRGHEQGRRTRIQFGAGVQKPRNP